MSLSSYLAQKYLTAEKASSSSTSKKRKRKGTSKAQEGLIIADDEEILGLSSTAVRNEDDDSMPTFANTGSAEFRKAKKSNWKVVGVPIPAGAQGNGFNGPNDDGAKEADAILAAAAAENQGNADRADEAPVVEDLDSDVVKMGDGTHAGLQSAAAVSAQFQKRKREEAEAWEKEERARNKGKGKKTGEEETVYRDATGRRIDLSMRRAEARKEAEAKARKEKEELDLQKGEVQLAERAKRKEDLEEARFMTVARGVDDVEMNDELKQRERWNDPAAAFLSTGTKDGGGARLGKRGAKGRKRYNGAAAPNRYGIMPGWRWDGVDRGNGWEGERFKGLNRQKRNKEMSFQWEMDE